MHCSRTLKTSKSPLRLTGFLILTCVSKSETLPMASLWHHQKSKQLLMREVLHSLKGHRTPGRDVASHLWEIWTVNKIQGPFLIQRNKRTSTTIIIIISHLNYRKFSLNVLNVLHTDTLRSTACRLGDRLKLSGLGKLFVPCLLLPVVSAGGLCLKVIVLVWICSFKTKEKISAAGAEINVKDACTSSSPFTFFPRPSFSLTVSPFLHDHLFPFLYVLWYHHPISSSYLLIYFPLCSAVSSERHWMCLNIHLCL